MNALIIADLEGIYDVYDLNDTGKCIDRYTDEISICIRALQENSVEYITVCDAHNDGKTIKNSIQTENVTLVSKLSGIDFNMRYDFAILIGFHGKGQSNGIFPHTLRFDIKGIYVTGNPIGEVELYCRWLGYKNIPVILIAGDSEAVAEANEYCPYRQTCCIKSLRQTSYYPKYEIYKKLATNIQLSMSLDFSLCISPDIDEMLINFVNDDIPLALHKYTIVNNIQVKFFNCHEFVQGLYPFFDAVNEATDRIVQRNGEFIKKIRIKAKSIKKDSIQDPFLLKLLHNDLRTMDEKTRILIEQEIERLFKGVSETHEII